MHLKQWSDPPPPPCHHHHQRIEHQHSVLRKWKKQETGNPRIYDTRTVPFSSRENSLKQVHHFTMRLSYHHHQKEEKKTGTGSSRI